MRRLAVILLAAGLATAAAGCRSTSEHVEAELRARDHDLRELRAELERTEAYNQYLQRELRHIQHTVAGSPLPDGAPGHASPVRTIVLGRQTGGFEDDGIPGDEALQVVLEPRDHDNHTIKAAGSVQVQALEVMPEGIKKPLCSWQVSAEELRSTWRRTLLSTGYFLVLPWKSWPSTCKLRVVVQFISEDQRLFEADRDVEVRVAPALHRKPPPPLDPALPLPAPGKPEETLPPPRKLEPEKGEKKEEKKQDLPPAAPDNGAGTASTSYSPARPLRGAVEVLRPVPVKDE